QTGGWGLCSSQPLDPLKNPEVECAIQLRRIGDKLNFRQKLVNLIAKLLRSGT
uniref:Phorbol-12-myristate-13-acetate-induced protein 1 n=1 Tax=Capra hircus TaxID=9925 RepID=A0A8C2R6N9_CAPHI